MGLAELLAAAEQDDREDGPKIAPSVAASRLKDHLADLMVRHEFKVGDLVEWKPGLVNKNGDGPFIVSRVLDEPVMNEGSGAGTPYFREPLDIVLMEINSGGNAYEFHYDSRRFRPYTGDVG
jgi:hypothetical protein